MDWMTKLKILQYWHAQSTPKQQALVKGYITTHPGISTSDDWLLYLAEVFGVGKFDSGYLDLDSMVQ